MKHREGIMKKKGDRLINFLVIISVIAMMASITCNLMDLPCIERTLEKVYAAIRAE